LVSSKVTNRYKQGLIGHDVCLLVCDSPARNIMGEVVSPTVEQRTSAHGSIEKNTQKLAFPIILGDTMSYVFLGSKCPLCFRFHFLKPLMV